MMLPESQLHLDDIFAEMLDRIGELTDMAMATDGDEFALTDAQLTSISREFVWEFLARALLLAVTRDKS